MNERLLKNQISVFGKFHFPPVPQTTIQLTQAFQNFEMMPGMVNFLDQQTGQFGPRISLQRAIDALQVVFSDDRIDISQNFPVKAMSFEEFFVLSQKLLGCLESFGLRYTRLAIVHEILIDELAESTIGDLVQKILPRSSPDSPEWTARWVNVSQAHDQSVNACCEVQRMAAVLAYPEGKQYQFNGLKLMSDVSTSPQNLEPRFDSNNSIPVFQEIWKVCEAQRASLGL